MTFKSKLEEFKLNLANSIYINPSQRKLFNQIPESFFKNIFIDNFNGDIELAKNILFKKYNNIDRTKLENDTKKIFNYKKALKTFLEYAKSDKPIVFITDIDNDGSLSQSIILEFKKEMPKLSENIHIVYSQNINGNTSRGFTVDLLEKWAKENNISKDDDFLMLTADNGINSYEEQEKIEKEFSKCNLIITDHHLPDPALVVRDTKRTIVFNPKNKPIPAFKKKNISGAHTLGILLKNAALEENPDVDLRNFHNLFYCSNLLDYVNADIRFKPLEGYLIDQFNSLGGLCNVNNSISKIITGELSEEFIDNIVSKIPELNREEFMDALNTIKEQNLISSKLLLLQKEFEELSEEDKKTQDDSVFYRDYVNVIASDRKFTHFNTNYIEQLRPRIYHHTVNGDKTTYEVALLEQMKSVYENLRYAEKRIIKELRKGDIMEKIKLDNTTLLYPKYPEINKLFNRKLLNKVFNEEINGFLAMFDGGDKSKRMGSCRTQFDLSDILSGIDKIDNIELTFQGHERAAGFFVERTDGKNLDNKDMMNVSLAIQKRINVLKEDASYNQKYVSVDFHNIGLIQAINEQCKSHVNNVSGINPVIKLNRSMHFTDKESLKTVSIGSLLKKESYGYTLLNLNFHGDTIIIPTEIVRQLSQNNFKDYLQINYMSEGAFIAYKIVPTEQLKAKDLIKLDSPKKKEQEVLSKYYLENFVQKNTFVKDVPREKMKEIDFFKNNGKFGDSEFAAVESFFIGIIDKYSEEIEGKEEITLIIGDTEANGLGKSPKLFNFGAFEVTIDPDSGEEMPLDKFIEQYNKNKKVYQSTPMNIKFDYKNNKVILNRRIKGELLSMLIRDKDFKLTQDIQALTGISQSMLNKHGITTGEADKVLTERYKDKKFIFQAHNSNYDVGVMASNLPSFKELLDKNLVCDSARFAKEERLAYPDTYVATLCPEAKKAFFFNDPLADYSISKMLNKEEDIQFPDIRGDYLVKTKGEEVFLIDLKKDIETLLPYKKEELAKNVSRNNTELHLNMLKYSVVALAKYENIRSVVLHDLKEKINFIDTPELLNPDNCTKDFDQERADRLFKEFCRDYHFDCNLMTNLHHFKDAIEFQVLENTRDQEDLDILIPEPVEKKKRLTKAEKEIIKLQEEDENRKLPFHELLAKSGLEFLKENKELHLRFTTIWEYQKVLNVYDPDKSLKDTDDLTLNGIKYNTGLPLERIGDILTKVYNYKQHYNLENIYTEELHNNIDENGDAMIEGLLVGQRLMRKHYNSYDKQRNFSTALKIYSNTLNNTSYRNILRQHMEVEIAEAKVNSYSQKQQLSYSKRRTDQEGNLILSPIVKNAFDPKRTKWQLKCLPQGTFIEALPDESFVTQKLIGTQSIVELNEDVKSIQKLQSLNMEEVYVNRIKGNEEDLTKEMTEVLSNLKKEDLELAKREIESAFVFIANKRVVEIILQNNDLHKNLKSGLKDIIEESSKREEKYISQLIRDIGQDVFDSIQEDIDSISVEIISDKQLDEIKQNNGSFLKTKFLDSKEKADIEEKMIFISKRKLMENSLTKIGGGDVVESIQKYLQKTEKKAKEYLEDIESRIGKLRFTRSENEIKKVVEQVWDAMQGKSRTIKSPNYHKANYNEFYKNLVTEYKGLSKRLGVEIEKENIEKINKGIEEWTESPYVSFDYSMDSFKRIPLKFITEECGDIYRTVIKEQVKESIDLKSDLEGILIKSSNKISLSKKSNKIK
jgi:hypothetical protein